MPASKRAQQSRHSAQGTPAVAVTGPSTSAAAAKPAPISTSTTAAAPPATNPTSRVPPAPAPASPTVPATPASKLPRFLQSPAQRDRSKSLSVDRPPSAASSSAASTSTSSSSGGGRRFLGLGKDTRERERQRIRDAERTAPSAAELLTLHESGNNTDDFEYDDVRPPGSPPSAYSGAGATARPRTRSERRFSFSQSTPPPSSSGHSSDHGHGQTLQLARSPSRLGGGEVAARLSGWFAHLSGSTNDLSLTATLSGALSHSTGTAAALASSTTSNSRKSEGGGGAGKGLLDKAVRYLLDGDAAPDRSTQEIWLLGVRLPGWGPEDERRVAQAQHAHSHSTSKSHSHSTNANANDGELDAGAWPARFHAHFYAQVWCTYRAGFEPIRDLPSLASLPPPLFVAANLHNPNNHTIGVPPLSPSQSDGSVSSTSSHSPTHSHNSHVHAGGAVRRGGSHLSTASTASSASNASTTSTGTGTSNSSAGGGGGGATQRLKRWWPLGAGTQKGWTSDAGWGCMLRTAQSLLATALQRVGDPPSDPTIPSFPPRTPSAHAAHARLLTWFLDAPAAPFGVHRMALAGKAAGKDVGMWFGPSAAAGAVRILVDSFPACGLGVSVATDGTLYQTETKSSPRHTPSRPAPATPTILGPLSPWHGSRRVTQS